MSNVSLSTALIPYTPLQTAMEFIQSQAEKNTHNSKPIEHITLNSPSSQEVMKRIQLVTTVALAVLATLQLPHFYLSPKATMVNGDRIPPLSKKLNQSEFAKVFWSGVAFTHAADEKPIIVSSPSSFILGGYDPTNKTAFIVSFPREETLEEQLDLISFRMSCLAKENIVEPIQLHFRTSSTSCYDVAQKLEAIES